MKKFLITILMAASILCGISVFCCYQDPGDQYGVVSLPLMNSIVGINYYDQRIEIDDDGNIKLQWKGESTSRFVDGFVFTTSQTVFKNGMQVGIPITLWFSLYSSDYAQYIVTDKDIGIQVELRTAELYYKVVDDLSTASQQSKNWHLCNYREFPNGIKTVFNPDSIEWTDKGAMLFGRNTLSKNQIEIDNEDLQTGDYIIFFFAFYDASGACNVNVSDVPQSGTKNPILPTECLQAEGKGYMNGHIFWVQYNGTEVFWR